MVALIVILGKFFYQFLVTQVGTINFIIVRLQALQTNYIQFYYIV